jgi:predicted CopG family antitoxin
MAKSYAQLLEEAEGFKRESDEVSGFSANAEKLPYILKDEFRKAQGTGLDDAISKARSNTFGAAIEGLNKYQDISNPFARRDLAEKYQSGVQMGWESLVNEKQRRQGVFSDYIDKWSGLFGADAARRRDSLNTKMSIWDREKSISDSAYSRAQSEKKSGLSNSELIREISDLRKFGGESVEYDLEGNASLKQTGMSEQEMRDYLMDEYGVDITPGSFADNQIRNAFGKDPYKETQEQTSKQKFEELKYKKQLEQTQSFGDVKPNKESAKNGEYYYDDEGNVRKRSKWWVFDAEDEIVGQADMNW